jgi:hypothetical protein
MIVGVMSGWVYQSDAAAEPESSFIAGELELAVVGNRGRLLDARRTPLSLTGVDLKRAEIEVRIEAFEDVGARWRLPAWEITRLQFATDSARVSAADAAALRQAVETFNRPLVVETDRQTASEAWRRVAQQRERIRPVLAERNLHIDLEACVERREGHVGLQAELDTYLDAQGLLDMDQRFCATMVSNPQSGELIKGHAIVLAELGLCRFDGTVVRDPRLFDGSWSRESRARHLVARMAFAQELWASVIGQPLILYRAAATATPLNEARPASFVSCTFSEQVADAHFAGGPTTPYAVKWRQAVNPMRLLMTFLETAAFNRQFKEAEAVLLAQPNTPAF